VEVSFAVDRDTVTLPFDFGATERTRSDISPHREQVNSRVILDSGRADDRNWHDGEPEGGAKLVRLCPCSSDINLFSYGKGIIDFDAEIPHGALDLCMS
jgi:hypothetical protein